MAFVGLQKLEPYLRSQVGKAMQMRHVPELRFFRDDGVARGGRVLSLLPDAAETHHALAYTLHAQGKHAASATAYARALALDPGDARIHNNLGNLAKDQGDFARAVDSYSRAIALDPGFAWAHCLGACGVAG